MDLAVKKIELINWLTTQDETMIKKVDALRRSSIESAYRARMGENLESKLTGVLAQLCLASLRWASPPKGKSTIFLGLRV